MGWYLTFLVPFLGTVLGAATVLGIPMGSERVRRRIDLFSAGAMVSAAFINLLMPGAEIGMIPVGIGFLLGMGLFLAVGEWRARDGQGSTDVGILLLVLVLHNIPEGLAVGASGSEVSGTAIGIAVQNLADGAMASVPLVGMGIRKGRAFLLGAMTGIVEPVAALLAMGIRSGWMDAVLMGFAAGAMVYVVIRELTPRMNHAGGMLIWYGIGVLLVLAAGGIT